MPRRSSFLANLCVIASFFERCERRIRDKSLVDQTCKNMNQLEDTILSTAWCLAKLGGRSASQGLLAHLSIATVTWYKMYFNQSGPSSEHGRWFLLHNVGFSISVRLFRWWIVTHRGYAILVRL